MKEFFVRFTVVISVLVLFGCGSAEKRGSSGSELPNSSKVTPVVIDGVTGTNVDPNSIAGRAPAERTIYFDFDNADIRSEYLTIIAEHGRYLSQNPTGRVRLEGHTDERGTREYNVALGESRSKSVARMLKLQGVSSAQVRTVSYGEELPVDEGHSQVAWDKNRRVNIVYEIE